jgi:hypothetical protein
MKFVIDGTEYEAANLERITGIDAMALADKKQAGLGVQTLARRLEELGRLGYDADGNVIVQPEGSEAVGAAVMDSEPHLRALLAFLWMSRRLGGERNLSFADACTFQFSTLVIVDDDPEPEDVTPDPTLPGSDPVEPPEVTP